MNSSEINGILCNRCGNTTNSNNTSANNECSECKDNRLNGGDSLTSLLTSSSSSSITSKYNHNNHHFYYYNNNKRFNFNFNKYNNNKLILFLLRLALLITIFVIFGVSVIMVYEKFTTPVFNSDLYNSTFACHDSLTCEQRYSMNNHHQNNSINTSTPTSTSTSSTPNNVFISSLYSDSYLPGILLLGYTIKKHHPNHKMYLIFLPDKLSENTICQVKKIGWIPKIVERVPPPWEGVHFTFVDQFTKLQMWSFTEYDSLIYIDGDAILTNKIDHLFELVNGKTGFEFAAAPDVWNGRTTVNFNAGLMLIKPNEAVFKEIMRVHKIRGTYDIDFAEQAFLNEYFRFRGLQLPQIYNTNISMMNVYPHLWKVLLNDMKVVHYTSRKPFIKPNPGIFKEPYDLWNQLYQEMDSNINLKRIEKDCRVVNNYF